MSIESYAALSQCWRLVDKELFDIANDPSEDHDVVGKYPEVVAKMRKAYYRWWEQILPFMVNEARTYARDQPD